MILISVVGSFANTILKETLSVGYLVTNMFHLLDTRDLYNNWFFNATTRRIFPFEENSFHTTLGDSILRSFVIHIACILIRGPGATSPAWQFQLWCFHMCFFYPVSWGGNLEHFGYKNSIVNQILKQ